MNEQQKPFCFGREYHGVCPNDKCGFMRACYEDVHPWLREVGKGEEGSTPSPDISPKGRS